MESPDHPTSPDAIARAVSAELHRRGYTTTFAAALAGIHRTALCRWLNGQRSVTTATAAKVLDALDLRIVPEAHAAPAHRNGVHHKPPG